MSASRKPSHHSGDISPITVHLRGPVPLTEDQRRRARFLRFELHKDWADIAMAMGLVEEDVRHALANARSPRSNPTRLTLNVSEAVHQAVLSQRLPGEPIWSTMNRLFGV